MEAAMEKRAIPEGKRNSVENVHGRNEISKAGLCREARRVFSFLHNHLRRMLKDRHQVQRPRRKSGAAISFGKMKKN
jgi:hypothetical protein